VSVYCKLQTKAKSWLHTRLRLNLLRYLWLFQKGTKGNYSSNEVVEYEGVIRRYSMIWGWTWDVNALIAVVIFWIVGVVLLFIVPRNRKPSSATAWLLLTYVLPLLGLIFFFLIGSPKLSKRRRAMQCSMSGTIVKAVAEASLIFCWNRRFRRATNHLSSSIPISAVFPPSVEMPSNSFQITLLSSRVSPRRSTAHNVLFISSILP